MSCSQHAEPDKLSASWLLPTERWPGGKWNKR